MQDRESREAAKADFIEDEKAWKADCTEKNSAFQFLVASLATKWQANLRGLTSGSKHVGIRYLSQGDSDRTVAVLMLIVIQSMHTTR